jgi:hypothetical protein
VTVACPHDSEGLRKFSEIRHKRTNCKVGENDKAMPSNGQKGSTVGRGKGCGNTGRSPRRATRRSFLIIKTHLDGTDW